MIAMEDVSEMMTIASKLASYTNQLEKTLTSRTNSLELKIAVLEKTIRAFSKK